MTPEGIKKAETMARRRVLRATTRIAKESDIQDTTACLW